MVLCLATLTDY